MSDFFGSVFDTISDFVKPVTETADDFFDGVSDFIGFGKSLGIGGDSKTIGDAKLGESSNSLTMQEALSLANQSDRGNITADNLFRAQQRAEMIPSVDAKTLQREWMERLRAFSQQ